MSTPGFCKAIAGLWGAYGTEGKKKLDRKRIEFSASIVIGILLAAVLGSLWRTRGLTLIVETLVAAITGGLLAYLLYPRFFPEDQR